MLPTITETITPPGFPATNSIGQLKQITSHFSIKPQKSDRVAPGAGGKPKAMKRNATTNNHLKERSMKIHIRDLKTGDILEISKEDLKQNWVLKKTIKNFDYKNNLTIDYYYEHTKNKETIQGNLFESGNKRKESGTTQTNSDSGNTFPISTTTDWNKDRIGQMGDFEENF